MTDEFKVQWSVSLPPVAQYAKGHMLNLRGNTVGEVESLIDGVMENDGEFLTKAVEVGAILLLAQGFNTPEPDQTTPSSGPADSGPVATLHVCQHGKREYKTGGGGNTGKKAWAAWMCPQPKGAADKCSPEWVD